VAEHTEDELRAEYERGYNNGYRAGRNFKPNSFSRQAWRCVTCDRFGFVLVRSADTVAKVDWRIEQSHDAQTRGKKGCTGPNLVRLTNREYDRAAKGRS
jgi:hypothetical protein